MSWNKRFTQGIALSVCTLSLACVALAWGGAKAEEPAELTATGTHAKAGMIATLEESQNNALDLAQAATVSIEKAETDMVMLASKSEAQAADEETEPQEIPEEPVAADKEAEPKETSKKTGTADEDLSKASEKTEAADEDSSKVPEEAEATGKGSQETPEEAEAAEGEEADASNEKQLSKTEQEWQDKVMADVDDSLSIRAKGKADAEIVGKLYPTSVATVLKEGKTWTKIESGSVKGYVKNKYLLFGEEAYKNAKKVCKTYAYVKTDGLRVRSKANEEAEVLTVADKGDKLLFNGKAKKVDGWVAVKVKAGKGYVSDEFVKVKLGTTKAVSIEEIEAEKAKTVNSWSGSRVSVSSNDMTLLAAIIQCEAGSECYVGKVAVGAVVLNRVHSSRWPNTISGVIYQSGQFSPVRNGSLARVLASGNISSSCRQAAADALAGSDPTGGKMFFHRANGARGVIIGNHVFY